MMQKLKDYSLGIGDLTYIEEHSLFLDNKLLTAIKDGRKVISKISIAVTSWFALWTSCYNIK